MRVLIVEDEIPALENLKLCIADADSNIEIAGTTRSVAETIAWLKNNNTPDLILMDIQLSDGLCFHIFHEYDVRCPVIFTTAFDKYMVEAFEYNCIDYLLKPFDLERFQKGVGKAVIWHKLNAENNTDQQKDFLYIHSDYKVIKIPYKEIIFVEASDDYAKINTNSQSYLTLLSMKAVFEKLSKNLFIRIHRSYIVAINQIAFVQFRKIGLVNGMELPVGDTYRNEIAKLKKG